jgi:hypothetical protein
VVGMAGTSATLPLEEQGHGGGQSIANGDDNHCADPTAASRTRVIEGAAVGACVAQS